MINRLHIREILAWMTLVISIILFGVTIAFAQTQTINVDNDNGKVHIIIKSSENGKTVKLDTTFSVTNEMDVDKIVDDFSKANGLNYDADDHSVNNPDTKKDPSINKKRKMIVIDGDDHEMTTEEKQKLNDDLEKSMDDLKQGLDNMDQSLKKMHFHIDCFDDGNKHGHKNYNWQNMKSGKASKSGGSYSYNYSFSDDNETDSLDDDNHIIIHGNKDENPPVLEKVITSKEGKKIFIYKRSESDGGSDKEKDRNHSGQISEKRDIKNLKYYPNPSNGKFSLSFRSDEKNDISIQVLDENGIEVYNEKLHSYSGDYSKEIDLSGRSKGNYVLKITLGKISHSAKIVFN